MRIQSYTPQPAPIQPTQKGSIQPTQKGSKRRMRKCQIPISDCSQRVGESPKLWTTDYQWRCALPPTTCRFLEKNRNKPEATGNRLQTLLQKLNQRKGCSLRLCMHLPHAAYRASGPITLQGPKSLTKTLMTALAVII